MNLIINTALAVVLTFCFLINYAAADPPGGFYTTRYDHLDIENILNQKRLVYYYTECLLDRGPCTPQGIEFKRILPEALRTNCLRCTEKQRFVTMKSIRRLKKEYPDVWGQLAAIWDPSGLYVEQLEESITKKINRSPEVIPLFNRFGGDDDDTSNVQSIAPKTTKSTTVANVIANKPVSFSTTQRQVTTQATTPTTTQKPVSTTTQKPVSTTTAAVVKTTVTTHRPVTSKRQEPTQIIINLPTHEEPQATQKTEGTTRKIEPTTTTTTPTTTKRATVRKQTPTTPKRIPLATVGYNYDFAFTTKPIVRRPAEGFNVVIRGVNSLIAPITDVAGKVISLGTDLAGMFLNVLGVRKSY